MTAICMCGRTERVEPWSDAHYYFYTCEECKKPKKKLQVINKSSLACKFEFKKRA